MRAVAITWARTLIDNRLVALHNQWLKLPLRSYPTKHPDHRLIGIADFLRKRPGPSRLGDYDYEPWDTKLARKAKPYFVIQLCCYADLLQPLQGRLADHIHIVLDVCTVATTSTVANAIDGPKAAALRGSAPPRGCRSGARPLTASFAG